MCLKPANNQTSTSSLICSTSSATVSWFLSKILLFRSFQISTRWESLESRSIFYQPFATFYVSASTKQRESSKLLGVRKCHLNHSKMLNQVSRAKEQETSKWSIASASWSHRAQESSSCRLWRFLLSAVQHLSCRANQTKNLHLPGALALCSIFAPGMACWPMKKAL